MSGKVIATSWPVYEGSVRTSWYPVMEVLKTTSPKAVPAAPYRSPRKLRPSSSTSTAGLATGGSCRNRSKCMDAAGLRAATIYRRGTGCQPSDVAVRLAGGGGAGRIVSPTGGGGRGG